MVVRAHKLITVVDSRIIGGAPNPGIGNSDYADGLAELELSAFYMKAKRGGSLRGGSCREDEEEDLIFLT
eukprot:13409573-Heterocapsa_arctica.AAC.1